MRAKEAVRVKETRNESERAAIPKPSHTLRGGRERERETERERESLTRPKDLLILLLTNWLSSSCTDQSLKLMPPYVTPHA